MKDITESVCSESGDVLPLPVLVLHDLGLLRVVLFEDHATPIEDVFMAAGFPGGFSIMANESRDYARFRARVKTEKIFSAAFQFRRTSVDRWMTQSSLSGLVGESLNEADLSALFVTAHTWAVEMFSPERELKVRQLEFENSKALLCRFQDHVEGLAAQ